MPRQRPPRSKRLVSGRAAAKPALKPVRLWVHRNRSYRLLGVVLMMLGLGFSGMLLFVSFRWGLQLILDPEALPKLSGLFKASPSAVETKTLTQLKTALANQGQSLGSPLKFKLQNGETTYWLIPIHPAGEAKLAAIQIYQQQANEQLLLEAQTDISPIPENIALKPLLGSPEAPVLGQRSLPFTRVVALSGQPGWFTLEGRWRRHGINLLYGQIFHFDPRHPSLQMLLPWSSPNSQRPRWFDLDGAAPPDLLVDESVGLEPVFRGMQNLPQRGLGPTVQLRPVAWISVPVDQRIGPYRQALTLAQAGLWSEAFNRLQSLKSSFDHWPPAAEAQLRLLQHHAVHTKHHADQHWSSPTQKVLTLLIDGRWEAALEAVEAAPESLTPLQQYLARDQGRIWNRVSAFLRIHPDHSAAMVWGGLILQAQQDRSTAMTWLDRRSGGEAVKQQLQAVVKLATPAGQPELPPAAQLDTLPESVPLPSEQIIQGVGPVTAMTDVDGEDWYWPGGELPSLDAQQSWYAVDLIAWQRGSDWSSKVQAESFEGLWQQLAPMAQSLTLHEHPQDDAPIPLQLRGIRLQGQTLSLAATGAAPDAPLTAMAIAFNADRLLRLNSLTLPPRDPASGLQQHLKTALEAPTLEEDVLNQVIAEGHYHSFSLGDRPVQVLVLDTAALDRLKAAGINCDRTTPKAIVIAKGEVTYNNLFTPEMLVAITATEAPPQLLVWTPAGYRLQPYP